MNDNIMQDLITKYKQSCAIFAAFKFDLFNILVEQSMVLEQLAYKANAEPVALKVLLEYFKLLNIVEKHGDQWQLDETFKKVLLSFDKRIIDHEINLYEKWVTPSTIQLALKHGIEDRFNNRRTFKIEDNRSYCDAMYGSNVKLIFFWLKRILNIKSNISVLEIGRSPGVITLEIKKKFPESKIKVVVTDEFYEICCENLQLVQEDNVVEKLEQFSYKDKYDLICIFNTIHYLPGETLINWINNLKNVMNNESVVCVIDIFIDNQSNSFEKGLTMDWLTHGGVYHLDKDEINRVMNQSGMINTGVKELPEISAQLLFYKNKRGN